MYVPHVPAVHAEASRWQRILGNKSYRWLCSTMGIKLGFLKEQKKSLSPLL